MFKLCVINLDLLEIVCLFNKDIALVRECSKINNEG